MPADDDTDEALAKFGLRLDDECRRDTTIWVWPQNEKSVNLFRAVMNKWVVGPCGPVTLDLVQVEIVARVIGIKITPQRLSDLSCMEAVALDCLERKRR